MSIYFWTRSDKVSERCTAILDKERSLDVYALMAGTYIEDIAALGAVRFTSEETCKSLRRWDLLPTTTPNPVVGPKLLDILSATAKGNFQTVEVSVAARDGEMHEYKMVNITKIVDALDLTSSYYYELHGGVLSFRYVSFKLNSMPPNINLARDARCMSSKYASDGLRDAILSANVSGISLLTAEEKNKIFQEYYGRDFGKEIDRRT